MNNTIQEIKYPVCLIMDVPFRDFQDSEDLKKVFNNLHEDVVVELIQDPRDDGWEDQGDDNIWDLRVNVDSLEGMLKIQEYLQRPFNVYDEYAEENGGYHPVPWDDVRTLTSDKAVNITLYHMLQGPSHPEVYLEYLD